MYPKTRKRVHIGSDMHPKTAFWVHIVQLIHLTASIVPYCQVVKKIVKPQSVHSLRIGLNALGEVCFIFSHSLLYIGVSLSCFLGDRSLLMCSKVHTFASAFCVLVKSMQLGTETCSFG